MSGAVEIQLRQAQAKDAAALLHLMQQLGSETEFIALDRVGMDLTPDFLSHQLTALEESPNNLLLVAETSDGDLVGTASVTADSNPRTRHIGEVGIAVLQEFWGNGLGSLLLDEVIYWAEQSEIIRRLELTVQIRNERAVALYRKFDFHTEGQLARGARADDGSFVDVWLMSRLID